MFALGEDHRRTNYPSVKAPLLPDRFLPAARLTVLVFTLVGIGGMLLAPERFVHLTPINLLLNFGLLLAFVPSFAGHQVRFMILVFAAGLGVEMVGVETGRIFGVYRYGETLGPQLKNVPLLIGVNWLMLVTCTLSLSDRITHNIYLKSALGALLMTGLDFLIEPLCAKYGFWYWEAGAAPVRNYLAWFVISFFFQMTGNALQVEKRNPMAGMVFAMQVLFFVVLNVAGMVMS